MIFGAVIFSFTTMAADAGETYYRRTPYLQSLTSTSVMIVEISTGIGR